MLITPDIVQVQISPDGEEEFYEPMVAWLSERSADRINNLGDGGFDNWFMPDIIYAEFKKAFDIEYGFGE